MYSTDAEVVNVFVRMIPIVGMHHHGPRQLDIDVVHYAQAEPGNCYDPNAVCIYQDGNHSMKAAYIQRKVAQSLAPLWKQNILQTKVWLYYQINST